MRLFEFLLLLSNASWLASSILLRNRAKRIALTATSVMSLVLLVAHLSVEGYRIQLFLAYTITILTLSATNYSYFKKPAARQTPRFIKGFAYTVTFIMLAATAGFMYAFPFFKLPEPTGPHLVGTQIFHLTDSSREETFDAAKKGNRELMVQIWYPAQQTKGAPAPMIGQTALLKEEPLSKTVGFPSFIMNYLKDIPSHSYEGAEVSTSSPTYPIILLNHGYKSSRIYHTSQAEHLASNGYIVVSIDHTYSAFATVFPDGRIAPMKTDENKIRDTEYRNMVGKVWTDDIFFVLDQLELWNNGNVPSPLKGTFNLKGRLDLANVGVMGHSYGGAASYDAAYNDRIKAGINLDGALYRYHNRQGITKPFLFLLSEGTYKQFDERSQHPVYTDAELINMGISRAEAEEEAVTAELQVEHFANAARYGGQALYIDGMEHYNFADVQYITPLLRYIGMAGSIKPQRASSIVNEYSLAFFNKHLKGEADDSFTMLNNNFPEVKLARFKTHSR
ncbi:alpha/beta hydrolase family protein [Paenibacillus sp. GCM10027627]|uniref:alpha/beta hydrolase family protein n=1 Tax=unclassified Paenibacillus TaxID=185978 RepID=UPI003644D57D